MCYGVQAEQREFVQFEGGTACCLFDAAELSTVFPWFVYPFDIGRCYVDSE